MSSSMQQYGFDVKYEQYNEFNNIINDIHSESSNDNMHLKSHMNTQWKAIHRHMYDKDLIINVATGTVEKCIKLYVYTSNITPGSIIYNGLTGEILIGTVGSQFEDLYYKVSLATGICSGPASSNIVYFLTPADYYKSLGASSTPIIDENESANAIRNKAISAFNTRRTATFKQLAHKLIGYSMEYIHTKFGKCSDVEFLEKYAAEHKQVVIH